MGKGNLLQGMGRGKLGDTVFYRAMGSQMFRVRNRIVKNPKSVGQQIQRSLMATVTKAYSQLRVICDHSFENVAYGAASQSYFVKKNLDLLRKDAMTYLENNLSGIGEYNMPYIVAPGSVATVCPNRLLISEGSLKQDAFMVSGGGSVTDGMAIGFAYSTGSNNTLEKFVNALGSKMYTFIVVRALSPIIGDANETQGKALYSTEVLYSRIKRNDVVLTEEDAQKTISQDNIAVILKYFSIETNMKQDDNLLNWFVGSISFSKKEIAGCVIASAWNGIKWLRSTEYLTVNQKENFNEDSSKITIGSAFGLDFAYGLSLWTNTNTSMVTSDKLLNGGKFEADPDSFMPIG